MSGLAFEVQGLEKRFGRKAGLKDVSFKVASGERFVVFGPSGCGKTTLLRCLNRMNEPDAGTVLFQGSDITALDPTKLRRSVGYVFQRPAVIDGTVRDNIAMGLHIHKMKENGQVEKALGDVGLASSYLRKDASRLSGGEVQRMAIARALVLEPSVLLLDEPTSALDSASAKVVEEALIQLNRNNGVTLVWVTHDPQQARRVGGKLMIMDRGRVVEVGGPSAVLAKWSISKKGVKRNV